MLTSILKEKIHSKKQKKLNKKMGNWLKAFTIYSKKTKKQINARFLQIIQKKIEQKYFFYLLIKNL